ncbi:MAG: DNA-3-methyladenine glycosylase I [Arenicellales bacterium]
MTKPITRCGWVGNDPLYVKYHDREWGIPVYSDRKLFEMLVLEGAQAGLSWITILRKRAHYRRVFDHFDPKKIALYNKHKINSLLKDPGIVRNRLKVESTVLNAQRYLDLREREGRFSKFLWQFVGGEPVVNQWKVLEQVPVSTRQSDAMSKALKEHGFKFVGTTICYAFMQAVGMVNDHTTDCDFRSRGGGDK